MAESSTRLHVADVRKALAHVRRIWELHTPDRPINLCQKVHTGSTVAEFAFEFVLIHHTKRLQRNH